MFPTYGTLKGMVPVIETLTRLPGKAMGRALAVISTFVTVLGWFVGSDGAGFVDWLPFGVGIVGLIVAGFFTWRRHRLEKAVDGWVQAQQTTISGEGRSSEEVTILSQDGTPLGTDSAAQRNHDAMMEQTQLRDTWMPRVEAAQRGAIAAAGGTVNAPYLKDDLRVTLVSAISAGVLIPIETLFAFIAFFAVL